MTPPMPRPPATAFTDMLGAIGHVLADPEYAAAPPDEQAEMLALAVCTALAERRSIYIPLPATVRNQRQRAVRDAALVAEFDAGVPPGRLAARHGLSRRQVRRILRTRGHTPRRADTFSPIVSA